jgi:transposase
VARELGIQVSMRWQLELEEHQEKAFPGKGKTVDEELARLQRENQRLKQEVEILEKAIGIFTYRPQADLTQVSWSAEIPIYSPTPRAISLRHTL